MKSKLFKIFSILTLAFVLFMVASCDAESTTTVEIPEQFKIENDIVTFKSEASLKYRIELKRVSDGLVLKRYIESGTDLNTLNIPEGDYMIKIQAIKNNVESEYSEELSYHQKDLYLVNNIKEADLINGRFIKWMGRTSFKNNEVTMYYTAAGFSVKAQKVEEELSLKATITATNYNVADKQPYVVLVLDNDFENTITIRLTKQTTEIEFVGEAGFNVTDSEVHEFSLYKRSESIDSHIGLKDLTTTGKFIEGVSYKERKIEVIAASSSTGYGNLSNSNKTTSNSDGLHAFAFLTAQALNAEISIVSASGWGISASRWTSPNTVNMHDKYFMVDCMSNEPWDTSKYIPDVIVTNFGTNDLSYINNTSDELVKAERRENFIATYVDFLDRLHKTYPKAQIIILYGLMNESGVYEDHTTIYNRAIELIPNLQMLKINGDAKGYNSHPSVASHAVIAETLTAKIKEFMNW